MMLLLLLIFICSTNVLGIRMSFDYVIQETDICEFHKERAIVKIKEEVHGANFMSTNITYHDCLGNVVETSNYFIEDIMKCVCYNWTICNQITCKGVNCHLKTTFVANNATCHLHQKSWKANEKAKNIGRVVQISFVIILLAISLPLLLFALSILLKEGGGTTIIYIPV